MQNPFPYACRLDSTHGDKGNQSELYRHYANSHYNIQLRSSFGGCPKGGRTCPECGGHVTPKNWLSHLGLVHKKIETFLPKAFHMPKGSAVRKYRQKPE